MYRQDIMNLCLRTRPDRARRVGRTPYRPLRSRRFPCTARRTGPQDKGPPRTSRSGTDKGRRSRRTLRLPKPQAHRRCSRPPRSAQPTGSRKQEWACRPLQGPRSRRCRRRPRPTRPPGCTRGRRRLRNRPRSCRRSTRARSSESSPCPTRTPGRSIPGGIDPSRTRGPIRTPLQAPFFPEPRTRTFAVRQGAERRRRPPLEGNRHRAHRQIPTPRPDCRRPLRPSSAGPPRRRPPRRLVPRSRSPSGMAKRRIPLAHRGRSGNPYPQCTPRQRKPRRHSETGSGKPPRHLRTTRRRSPRRPGTRRRTRRSSPNPLPERTW